MSATTPNTYDYNQFWLTLNARSYIVFRVMACNDAHIGLSAATGNSKTRMYEFVIGGNSNTETYIRTARLSETKATESTEGILDCQAFRPFWVRWVDNVLELGEGTHAGKRSIIKWEDTEDPHPVEALTISTGFDAEGVWEFSYVDGNVNFSLPTKIENLKPLNEII